MFVHVLQTAKVLLNTWHGSPAQAGPNFMSYQFERQNDTDRKGSEVRREKEREYDLCSSASLQRAASTGLDQEDQELGPPARYCGLFSC